MLRTWIRNWATPTGKVLIGGKENDASLLLDELDKEPLALGTGTFVIHQEFHIKVHIFILFPRVLCQILMLSLDMKLQFVVTTHCILFTAVSWIGSFTSFVSCGRKKEAWF